MSRNVSISMAFGISRQNEIAPCNFISIRIKCVLKVDHSISCHISNDTNSCAFGHLVQTIYRCVVNETCGARVCVYLLKATHKTLPSKSIWHISFDRVKPEPGEFGCMCRLINIKFYRELCAYSLSCKLHQTTERDRSIKPHSLYYIIGWYGNAFGS